MALIHHVVTGSGEPPLVFVHGYACSHTDWREQVSHFAPRYKTIVVDLRGHGASPAAPETCTIENCGQDVADLMRALELPPAVIFGHSMGCRVALEAARRAGEHVKAIVLVDGSQFAAAMEPVMKQRFAAGEAKTVVAGMFKQMFTARTAEANQQAVLARALGHSDAFLANMMLSLIHYDLTKLETTLATTEKPLMVLQATFSDAQRNRHSMKKGQTTPYTELVHTKVPGAVFDVIENVGHFPQFDAPAETNRAIAGFLDGLGAC
jgi:pimeloyl-ACP methyl ester carboxylesterase